MHKSSIVKTLLRAALIILCVATAGFFLMESEDVDPSQAAVSSSAHDPGPAAESSAEKDAIGSPIPSLDLAATDPLEALHISDVSLDISVDMVISQDVIVEKIDIETPSSIDASLPVLALTVDDCGYNLKYAKRLLERDIRATWAIIPHLIYSKQIADLLDDDGVPYLIHLPMQAYGDPNGKAGKPKHYYIGIGMSDAEVRAEMLPILDSLPNAIGVNNHRGSVSTADEKLMRKVMTVLKERNKVFIDSNTTKDTVAFDVADAVGVDAMKNNIFLDNEPDRNKVKAHVETAIARAIKRGHLIAICHMRPETIAFFESIDESFFTDRGVRLVTIPELIALKRGGALKNGQTKRQ